MIDKEDFDRNFYQNLDLQRVVSFSRPQIMSLVNPLIVKVYGVGDGKRQFVQNSCLQVIMLSDDSA